MSFYTTINCMDGRVQLPVISYLMERFGVQYVDAITGPGPGTLFHYVMQTDFGSNYVVETGSLERPVLNWANPLLHSFGEKKGSLQNAPMENRPGTKLHSDGFLCGFAARFIRWVL